MSAVCIRCGGRRGGYEEICPACGFRPDGEGLLVAWLLSDRNLRPAELDAVAERIKRGEPPRPSAKMLDRARRALGRHLASDPGLTLGQRFGLVMCGALLTPLPGLVLAVWWRDVRPRAALQALALSLPFSVGYFFLVLYTMFR